MSTGMRTVRPLLLAVAVYAAAIPGGCQARSGSGAASPASADERKALAWLVVTSPFQGAARFVTVDRDGEVVSAEASSPNLETATLQALRQGRLPPGRTGELFAALERTDWTAFASPPGVEPIEQRRPLLTLSFTAGGRTRGSHTLFLDALPPDLERPIEGLLSTAGQLELAPPGGLVRASRVAPGRAETIRSDSRAFYRFLEVEPEELEAVPGLAAAVRHLGGIFPVSADGAPLLAGWMHRSNPDGRGDTLFLRVSGAEGGSDFQIDFKRWAPSKR